VAPETVNVLKVGEVEMVIWVEVPINTFCPPVMERLEPTVKEPRVVVPVPPLSAAKTPDTSLEPKFILPLNNVLDEERTIPVPSEAIDVEPYPFIVNKLLPDEDATVNKLSVGSGVVSSIVNTALPAAFLIWNAVAELMTELMVTSPDAPTERTERPLEEATLKIALFEPAVP